MDISLNETLENSRSPDQYLYSVELAVSVREFSRQQAKLIPENFIISSDTLCGWKNRLWIKSKTFLKRRVIFDNDSPKWDVDIQIKEEDFDNFVSFNDKKGKKHYELSSINTTILHNWKKKEIVLILHIYSKSVVFEKDFLKVQEILLKPYEKDRSKAIAQTALQEIMKELQNYHRDNYKSAEINWYIWANYIVSQDAHLKDELMRSPPPPHLITNFEPSHSHSERIIGDLLRDSSIANSINQDYREEILQLIEVFKKYNDIQDEAAKLRVEIHTRLNSLGIRTECNNNVLQSVNNSISVHESSHSNETFNRITEQFDKDHVFP